MAELEELRTFIAAARIGSFAKAGRQLNLSPAMVGRRIQALEQRYGAKLIERTTRNQRLTETGQAFLARAEAVIEATAALDEISAAGTLTGRLRVSAPTTLGIRRLPAIIAQFTEAHPAIVFEMSLANRRVDLVAEGYDLAVRVGDLPSSSLVARRLGTYGFVCCAAPAFIARHGAPQHPTDLTRCRCILNLNLVPRNRWSFLDAGGTAVTVEVMGGVEIDSDEAQRMLAIDGAGVVYLPLDLVQDDIEAGRLVPILQGWRLPTMPIHTLHPSRDLVPRRVTAFIAALVEEFRDAS
ncbi:LysR family transcriptional regulator [Devosia sp. XGJD_8]|uniref:LysR family transcriptional regulator n=1 Tax=Devosia sp. XGJD_8 TaxID=3391187 RepID=UPI00398519AD